MMMKKSVAALYLVVAVFLVAEMHDQAAALGCDPNAVTPCLPFIMRGGMASPECCDRLKDQKPCLCQLLISNPYYQPYADNIKNMLKQCGLIHLPDCP